MVVPANMTSDESITPPENRGIFQITEAPSARPTGIAIAIAMLVLFFCFVVLFGVGIYVRKRAAQQAVEAASMRTATPSVQREFTSLVLFDE
jgi:cytochrome c-type biogenesis protein CcmH/NrfG